MGAVRLAGRLGFTRPAGLSIGLTYSFWGNWAGPVLAPFRKGMAHALAERGLTPLSSDAVADVVFFGPKAPRLAVWSQRKPVDLAVGILVGEGSGREAAGRLSFVAKHHGWDALVWLNRRGETLSATIVDDLAFADAVAPDADPATFFAMLAGELIEYLPAARRAHRAGSEAHR